MTIGTKLRVLHIYDATYVFPIPGSDASNAVPFSVKIFDSCWAMGRW